MANPADRLASQNLRIEEIRDAMLQHVQVLADTRRALRNVLEGIDTARASFPPDSPEALALDGALAGCDRDAELVLQR